MHGESECEPEKIGVRITEDLNRQIERAAEAHGVDKETMMQKACRELLGGNTYRGP